MRKAIMAALTIMASAAFTTANAQCCNAEKAKTAGGTCCKDFVVKPAPLTSHNDSVSYAAGYMLSEGLETYLEQQFQISDEDMPFVLQGYRQGIARRNDKKQRAVVAGLQVAQMLSDRMLPHVEEQYKSNRDSLNEALVLAGFEAALRKDTTHYQTSTAQTVFHDGVRSNRSAEGVEFLAQNAKKKGVKVLPSGLQYKVLKKGNGNVPTSDDKVQVIYEGRTIDGHVFDATSKHNLKDVDYDEFAVKGLIKGWQEALSMMPVGSKWEIYIPYDLAYGERGAGKDIPPYSALVFTMELKGIAEAKKDGVTEAQKANPKTVRSQTAPVGKTNPKTVRSQTAPVGKKK